jgi:alkaline phosphatase D
MDAWDGYVASRDRILNHVRLSNPRIQNPVVLSGDVHNNWACDLKADFNNPYSQTLGVEFVGTSVTSGGDGADTGTTQEAIVKHNPHIKFFNGQRGYVRCTLTPTEWLADYRVLPYVKQPGATISTRATFTVAAGKPGLQLVTQQAPVGVRSSEAAIESDRERGRAQRQR